MSYHITGWTRRRPQASSGCWTRTAAARRSSTTPNLPTNIVPTNIAWLKLSEKFPMDMRIPPLKHNIMLESNPLRSTMLVGRLGVILIVHRPTEGVRQKGFQEKLTWKWLGIDFLAIWQLEPLLAYPFCGTVNSDIPNNNNDCVHDDNDNTSDNANDDNNSALRTAMARWGSTSSSQARELRGSRALRNSYTDGAYVYLHIITWLLTSIACEHRRFPSLARKGGTAKGERTLWYYV